MRSIADIFRSYAVFDTEGRHTEHEAAVVTTTAYELKEGQT